MSGRAAARGMRYLSGGAPIQVGAAQLLNAFRHLAQGEPIDAIGTYSHLAWDDRGAIASATLEIWCVNLLDGTAAFTSSGLTADIPAQTLHGANTRCSVSRPQPPERSRAAGMEPNNADGPAPSASATADAGVEEMAGDAGMSSPRRQADAGTGGDLSTPPPVAARPIPCGELECDRGRGEYCCISRLLPVNPSQDYSCETAPASCASSLRCSSDKECDFCAICCLTEQHESYCSATSSCGSQELHLACNRPTDCAQGQRCCSHSSDPAALADTSCAASCEDVAVGSVELCNRQSQCDTVNGCNWKPFLPTIGVCL